MGLETFSSIIVMSASLILLKKLEIIFIVIKLYKSFKYYFSFFSSLGLILSGHVSIGTVCQNYSLKKSVLLIE